MVFCLSQNFVVYYSVWFWKQIHDDWSRGRDLFWFNGHCEHQVNEAVVCELRFHMIVNSRLSALTL